MVKLVFLTEKFFNDYADCKEIEYKLNRPHIQVVVNYNGNLFCVPMRSSIHHPHCILTDKDNFCGIDFSKAVAIKNKEEYIDSKTVPYIRPNEYKVLKNINVHDIENGLVKYIKAYKKAKQNPGIPRNSLLLSLSTLQYFEDYI